MLDILSGNHYSKTMFNHQIYTMDQSCFDIGTAYLLVEGYQDENLKKST
jgi:hypothetical protein